MKLNRITAVGWLSVLCISSVFARPASNEQIMINSTAAVVETTFSGGAPSLNIIADTSGIGGLISYGIAEGLKNSYGSIMLASAPDPAGANLYYDVLGFDFKYSRGGSRGFLRGRKIRRELQCELRINIREGEAFREARNLLVNYADEIEPSDTRFVNSRNIPELAPELPGSSWSRYAEPSLVIASVGALVYLFFANR